MLKSKYQKLKTFNLLYQKCQGEKERKRFEANQLVIERNEARIFELSSLDINLPSSRNERINISAKYQHARKINTNLSFCKIVHKINFYPE